MTLPSDRLSVDPELLHGRGESFREYAKRVERVAHETEFSVRRQGAPWGDDEAGQQFADQYGPGSAGVIEALSSVADVVRSIADGVVTMARGFHETEQNATDATDALRKLMGPDTPPSPRGA